MTHRTRSRFAGLLLIAVAATTLVGTPVATAADNPVLAIDSRGPAVTDLQNLLTNQGFNPGPIDGKFGPRTDAAVRAFQSARSLPVTGIVDAATWAALGGGTTTTGLRAGDRGDRVLELQRLLAAAGFSPGPLDGVFGSKTTTAARAFQQASSLPVTGIVDQTTWDRLAGGVVMMRRGSVGADVLEVQNRLAAIGYPPRGTDGKFGQLTEAAVRAFQGAFSLPVTGVVDQATLSALRTADTGPGAVLLQRGDRGTAVFELQNRLVRVGFSVGSVDGVYGERTATAVDRFQDTYRLPGDGTFNELTNRRLKAFERDAERAYAAGYVRGGGAEQWRALVTEVFALWGLDTEVCAIPGNPATCIPSQVEAALDVMWCESNGIPFEVNISSGVTGLFQHRMTYWADRVARVKARFPDFPSDASPFEPRHDTMVAAMLVWDSRDSLLKRLAAGGTMADGPHPWSHWTCRRAIDQ